MKYFRYIINIFIVVIIISLVVFKTKDNLINYKSKSLGIDVINKREEVVEEEKSDSDTTLEDEEEIEEQEEEYVVSNNPVTIVEEKKEVPPTVQESVVEAPPVVVQEPVSNNVETITGALSAYGPDCVGCSGYLASGFNALNGNIYYNDGTYGTVRIVAGDRSYPFGTIINIKGTWLGEVKAIVLDRGGGVGIGKRFLFDLLFSSEAEASSFGSYRNVTFEILRYGY